MIMDTLTTTAPVEDVAKPDSFKDLGFETLDKEEAKQAEIKKQLEIQSKHRKKFYKSSWSIFLFLILSWFGIYSWLNMRLVNNLVLTDWEKNQIKLSPVMSLYEKLPNNNPQTTIQPITNTGGLSTDRQNFDQIVGSNRFLYEKKIESDKKIINLLDSAKNVDKDIDIQSQEYISNWYYPKQLSDNVREGEIQKPIITIESIKLSTALQFYGLLNDFKEEYAARLWLSKQVSDAYLNYYKSIADTDILKYVQMCYMNPYIWDNDGTCKNEQDFISYFITRHKENMSRIKIYSNGQEFSLIDLKDESSLSNISKNFVVLMDLLIQKLDKEKLPALVITFNNFNPQTSTIKFSIEINSFDSTYEQLRGNVANITSPHEFMVTNLINLIRQSRLIKSENIKIQNQTIQTTNVKEWNLIYKKYTSKYDFELPVQKNVEREVSDFDFN